MSFFNSIQKKSNSNMRSSQHTELIASSHLCSKQVWKTEAQLKLPNKECISKAIKERPRQVTVYVFCIYFSQKSLKNLVK